MDYAMSDKMALNAFNKLFILFCFILCSSIMSGQTYLTATLNAPGNAGILSEDCGGPYELVLRRGPDNDSATTIFISGSGTATIGTDYQFPSGSFPADMLEDDTILIIPITVISDALIEGTETVHLEIAFLAGTVSDVITLETSIVDEYEVEIKGVPDTIVWCRNIPYVLLASSEAEEIFWTPAAFWGQQQQYVHLNRVGIMLQSVLILVVQKTACILILPLLKSRVKTRCIYVLTV
jgi:hypothetical protein